MQAIKDIFAKRAKLNTEECLRVIALSMRKRNISFNIIQKHEQNTSYKNQKNTKAGQFAFANCQMKEDLEWAMQNQIIHSLNIQYSTI